MRKWTSAETNRRLLYYVVFLFLLTIICRLELVGIYKANFGGTDQNVIYGIQRLLLGQPLYQNPSQPPFAIIQYTPLFYYLAAGTGRLLHIDGHAVQQVYVLSRLLNLALNLCSVALVAGIINAWKPGWQRALTYALPAIMILTTHYYTRIDSLELLFFVAAIAIFVRYLRRGGWWRIVLVAAVSAACVMSKQSGMLIIGVTGFSLLFHQRKVFTAFAYGLLTLAGIAAVAWFSAYGNWPALYQNAYLGLKNGLDLTWLYVIFTSQFYLDLVMCYAVGFMIARHAFKASNDPVYRFIGTGAVLSFLFALVTGLKIGSSNNYFTELLIFVLIGLPNLLQSAWAEATFIRLGRKTVSRRLFAGIAFFVLISSKTMGLFSSIHVEHRMNSDKADYDNELALLQYFKQELKLQKGEHIYFTNRVFLDNVFIDYSVMPSKDVIYQTYTASPKTFDYRSFIRGMNAGMVKYVVIGKEDKGINFRQQEEMPFVHFDESRFLPVAKVNDYFIYQYQP